ncbi:MAG: hypothetical protein FJ100_16620 [Deltaproteobacteria bacterium]|nr:hypothetical protein [Deltaproteobacteria bacterium]
MAVALAASFGSAAVASLEAHALGANQQLGLKVLVMSATGSEPSLQAWTSALAREGIPHDTFVANTADPLQATDLEPAANQGKYQAVVLATGDLAYCDATGCKSALDPAEWTVLNAYQAKFGVRRVIAYAWPNPAYGLNYPFQSGDVSNGTLTAAGAAAFPYLVGTVPLRRRHLGLLRRAAVAGRGRKEPVHDVDRRSGGSWRRGGVACRRVRAP